MVSEFLSRIRIQADSFAQKELKDINLLYHGKNIVAHWHENLKLYYDKNVCRGPMMDLGKIWKISEL